MAIQQEGSTRGNVKKGRDNRGSNQCETGKFSQKGKRRLRGLVAACSRGRTGSLLENSARAGLEFDSIQRLQVLEIRLRNKVDNVPGGNNTCTVREGRLNEGLRKRLLKNHAGGGQGTRSIRWEERHHKGCSFGSEGGRQGRTTAGWSEADILNHSAEDRTIKPVTIRKSHG